MTKGPLLLLVTYGCSYDERTAVVAGDGGRYDERTAVVAGDVRL